MERAKRFSPRSTGRTLDIHPVKRDKPLGTGQALARLETPQVLMPCRINVRPTPDFKYFS